MKPNLVDAILTASERQAMPVAVYPGLHLCRHRVIDLVTAGEPQFTAIAALAGRYRNPYVLTSMDLSIEAETFGASVVFSDDEIPTVTGRLVTDVAGIDRLAVPPPENGRNNIQIDVITRLRQWSDTAWLIGGAIGPFSLAARLYGVSEVLELVIDDPAAAHALLEKTTAFIAACLRRFKAAGADAVCMAEPVAGLLWPDGLAEFSSRYVKRLVGEVEDDCFRLVLHNCGCRIESLDAVLASGAKFLHFGAPMEVAAVLEKAPADVVIGGNLDPAAVFVAAGAEETYRRTAALLEQTAAYPNFVLSSGCDLPPDTPLANLDAFYRALAEFRRR